MDFGKGYAFAAHDLRYGGGVFRSHGAQACEKILGHGVEQVLFSGEDGCCLEDGGADGRIIVVLKFGNEIETDPVAQKSAVIVG